MYENVLINMWHNYSRGKNVIMTSSLLGFQMTRLHKNACFRLTFLHLFDVTEQNKLSIFLFLKMVSFVSLSRCIIL